ncbi:unnamed protein product [Rotaria sp. Silwood2]|nr:unnamed protein product [Rotaria sp. Silwood2]CAF3079805.1 unnamed protein product [Rotaria sp. Silwood2]CAF3084397.1 unnamed protein product [Rotaria sp. Silwood2]CAF4360432.1 unnamed protein product [Rotaria sp. Silwood2]CAF4440719.1 unnamed protein product [Rotaria sp. Silwood2]
MSFEQSTFESPPLSKQDNYNKYSRKPKSSAKSDYCKVCGDDATIINYGALSCQSCKTFFRRNGFRPESVRPCSLNRSCEVILKTRRNCTACRLAKCLSVGMSSELIRKEELQSKKSSSMSKSKSTKYAVSKQLTVCTKFK